MVEVVSPALALEPGLAPPSDLDPALGLGSHPPGWTPEAHFGECGQNCPCCRAASGAGLGPCLICYEGRLARGEISESSDEDGSDHDVGPGREEALPQVPAPPPPVSVLGDRNVGALLPDKPDVALVPKVETVTTGLPSGGPPPPGTFPSTPDWSAFKGVEAVHQKVLIAISQQARSLTPLHSVAVAAQEVRGRGLCAGILSATESLKASYKRVIQPVPGSPDPPTPAQDTVLADLESLLALLRATLVPSNSPPAVPTPLVESVTTNAAAPEAPGGSS